MNISLVAICQWMVTCYIDCFGARSLILRVNPNTIINEVEKSMDISGCVILFGDTAM